MMMMVDENRRGRQGERERERKGERERETGEVRRGAGIGFSDFEMIACG